MPGNNLEVDNRLTESSPNTIEFIVHPHLTVDLTTGRDDLAILGLVRGDSLDFHTRRDLYSQLTEAIFNQEEPLDQDRIGTYLEQSMAMYRASSEIFSDEESAGSFRQSIEEQFTPMRLKRLKDESNQYLWKADLVQYVLDAYCTFQTLEDVYVLELGDEEKGEKEAVEMWREIVRSTISSTELDKRMAKSAVDLRGKEIEGHNIGEVIWLGNRGGQHIGNTAREILKRIALQKYRENTQYYQNPLSVAGYYRSVADIVVDFAREYHPLQSHFWTEKQALAQLLRFIAGHRPNELIIPGMFNYNGFPSIFPSKPQVGGHVGGVTGAALLAKLGSLEWFGIKPEDESQPFAAVLGDLIVPMQTVFTNVLGDGAAHALMSHIKFQGKHRLPVVNLFVRNHWAIGVQEDEVEPGELSEMGVKFNVPGISVDLTENDRLALAMLFGYDRAYSGAGAIVVCAEAIREVPHSNAHRIPEASEIAGNIGDKYKQERFNGRWKSKDDEEIWTRIMGLGAESLLLDLRGKLEELLAENLSLPENVIKLIRAHIENIISPSEEMIKWAISQRYVTGNEVADWETEAEEKYLSLFEQLVETPRVNKRHAYPQPKASLLRLVDHALPFKQNRYTLTGAGAVNQVLTELGDGVRIIGIDVDKGREIDVVIVRDDHGNIIGYEVRDKYAGSYWGDTADIPRHRRLNMEIAELAVTERALGMSLRVRNPSERVAMFTKPVFCHLQYVDYMLRNWPALEEELTQYTSQRELGALCHAVFCANTGIRRGGGTGHSEIGLYKYGALPETGIDIAYPSSPQDIFQLLYHYLSTPSTVVFLYDGHIWNKPQEFVPDPYDRPGIARVVRQGDGPQIITIGAPVNQTREAIDDLDYRGHVSLLDLRTTNPMDWESIGTFLEMGAERNSPVVIQYQEPLLQSGLDKVAQILSIEQEFAEIMAGRGPVVVWGSKYGIDAFPADGASLDQIMRSVRNDLGWLVKTWDDGKGTIPPQSYVFPTVRKKAAIHRGKFYVKEAIQQYFIHRHD